MPHSSSCSTLLKPSFSNYLNINVATFSLKISIMLTRFSGTNYLINLILSWSDCLVSTLQRNLRPSTIALILWKPLISSWLSLIMDLPSLPKSCKSTSLLTRFRSPWTSSTFNSDLRDYSSLQLAILLGLLLLQMHGSTLSMLKFQITPLLIRLISKLVAENSSERNLKWICAVKCSNFICIKESFLLSFIIFES